MKLRNPTLHPRGCSLSLLDFTVRLTEEGKAEFEFYKKKAKKPLFVHHKSALPKHSKVNIIRNERKRISQRCSTEATTSKHNSNLDGILRLNGYPEEVMKPITPNLPTTASHDRLTTPIGYTLRYPTSRTASTTRLKLYLGTKVFPLE